MAIRKEFTDASERTPLLADAANTSNGSNGDHVGGRAELVGDDVQAVGEHSPLVKGVPAMGVKMHFLLPAVGVGVFFSALDQTIIFSSYGRIGSELHALNSTSWIATSYLLTLTAFQPLYGKLSDIFGRKPCLLVAYLIFGLGCLFCGLARNMGELIAARAFAGIGGGGMTTVVSILMSDIIPLRERGTWQGYINLIYATGAASGAPLGGIFSDIIGWRWGFICQAPMCFAAFVAVYFVLDLPKVAESHWKDKLKQVDFTGAICLVVAVSSLLLGLDHGSNYAWNNVYTIAALSLSLPLFAVFLYVEMKVASHPFAPGHVILDRSLLAAYFCNFFAFAGYMSTIFYIPLYFQAVKGLSATAAGIRLIPGICGSATGSIGAGIIMQKTGKYYVLTIVAYSLMLVGIIPIILCTGVVFTSTIGIVIGITFLGLGGGIGVTTSLIALISNADPKDQAVATACSYLFRSLGCAIGISLSATIVQQALRLQLRDRLDADDAADKIMEGVRQSLDYIKTLEPRTREIVRLCYQRSTEAAFVLTSVFVVGAIISACFIREKKLVR